MEIEVRRGDIEKAIIALGKYFQKNLKVELKTRRSFESKREKARRKQLANRRRHKRRALREAQRVSG